MGASLVNSGGPGFRVASSLSAEFDREGTYPTWRAEEVHLPLGPKAGMAVCIIESNAAFNVGNVLAFNPSGPLRNIKTGTAAKINLVGVDETIRVMNGSVVSVAHDLGTPEKPADRLIVLVADDRWKLENVRIVGRWVFDPRDSSGPWYQQGWAAWFNPGGRPNCIYYGGRPYFLWYPDFGMGDGREPADPSQRNETQATYWTLGAIFEYFWNHYSTQAGALPADIAKFPWLARVPDSLIWPENLGSQLDSEYFDAGAGQGLQTRGGARKGRSFVAEGFSLLDAMWGLLQIGGGWSLNVSPQGDNSVLSLERTLYAGSTSGINLNTMRSGKSQERPGLPLVTSGKHIENGQNFISAVGGSSQLVFIERRLSTEDNQIEWAHSAERWDMFKTLAAGTDINVPFTDSAGTTGSETVQGIGLAAPQAFDQALRILPDVMTLRIKTTFDFQEGTAYEGYPRAKISRPPLPELLSMLSDAGAFDFAGWRAPVYVEIKDDAGFWRVAAEMNGLKVQDNGIIDIPIDRTRYANLPFWRWDNPAEPWKYTGTLGENAKLNISLREVRMCLAIPCDHRLTSAVCSMEDGFDNAGVYSQNPDADRIAPKLQRRGYLDLGDLYRAQLRKDSIPRPESEGWLPAEDKPGALSSAGVLTNALYSDAPQMQQHLKRHMYDWNRLEPGGSQLTIDGHLCPEYAPGTMIEELEDLSGLESYKLRRPILATTLRCQGDYVGTTLTL